MHYLYRFSLFFVWVCFAYSEANAVSPPPVGAPAYPCVNVELFKKYEENGFDIVLTSEDVAEIRKAFATNGRDGRCIQQAIIEDKNFYRKFRKQYSKNSKSQNYAQLSDIIHQPTFLRNYLRGKPDGYSIKIFDILPSQLKTNKSFLKAFLTDHPETFESIDKELRADIDFISSLLSSGIRSDKIYPLLSREIKENRTMSLKYLATSCNLLKSWKELPEEFSSDKYFILDYYANPVTSNYRCSGKNQKTALPLSEELKNDKYLLNKLIKYNPEYQKYLSEETRKSPEFWISFVSNDANSLKKVPFSIRQNEKFIKLLIDRQGFNQSFISNVEKSVFWKVFKDKKYLNKYLTFLESKPFKAWNYYGEVLSFNKSSVEPFYNVLPPEFTENLQFANRIINIQPVFLAFLPSVIKNDKRIISTAVRKDFNTISLTSPKLQQNAEFITNILLNKSSGLNDVKVLKRLSNEIRNNKKIVGSLIKQKGPAYISIAGDELKNDVGFYFEMSDIRHSVGIFEFGQEVKDNERAAKHACEKDGLNYKHLSLRLKDNFKLAQYCLKNLKTNDPLIFSKRYMDESVASRIATNKEVMMDIFRKSKNHGIFYYAPDKIKHDKNFIMQALEYVPELINIIPYSIRNDKRLYMKAASKYGMILSAASNFKNDLELVKTAVTSNPNALQYASDRLRDHDEIVSIAAKKDRDSLRYASDRMKKAFNYSKDEEDREFINDDSLKMYIIDVGADKPTDWNRVNKIFEK